MEFRGVHGDDRERRCRGAHSDGGLHHFQHVDDVADLPGGGVLGLGRPPLSAGDGGRRRFMQEPYSGLSHRKLVVRRATVACGGRSGRPCCGERRGSAGAFEVAGSRSAASRTLPGAALCT